MPTTVLLATAAPARGKDPDEEALLASLASHGVDARPAVWDDPAIHWAEADLVVLRSTWDYAERRDEFLAWADRVAATTRLCNPVEVVRWNTDKRYLADLAAHGAQVVPTRFASPGEPVPLPAAAGFAGAAAAGEGEAEVVVKPAVAAGSRDAVRVRPDAPEEAALARDLATRLHAEGRDVIVQPYVRSVDERGETAMIFLGGAFSHAVSKGPMLRLGEGPIEGLFATEHLAWRTPSEGERAAAERALDATGRCLGLDPRDLVYARVDLVDGPDGAPMVLELELTEPSLFLRYAPGSVERLAAAIIAAASR